MADLDIENYKKSVAKAVDRWSKKMDAIGKQLDPITSEMTQLANVAKGDLPPAITDAVKKRQAELQKKADDLNKQIDKAAAELRADIMLLPPPKAADPKDTKKLPSWLEDIIKKGGVSLGDNVTLKKPDIDFDLKTGQLKKLVINFEIKFP